MSAPANDNFVNAELLTGDSGSTTGTTVDATVEVGEVGGAGFYDTGHTVWYRWTPSTSMEVLFWLDAFTGNGVYTAIEVFTGSTVDTLTPVSVTSEGNLSNAGFGFSANLTAGVTYQIRARAIYGLTYLGGFNLTWGAIVRPANDPFAGATVVTGTSGTVSGTTVLASAQAGEPASNGQTVWYRWTAPSSMHLRLTWTYGYAEVDVWTGSSVSALTAASDRTYIGVLEFAATSGVTYRWRVDAVGAGYPNPFTLSWAPFFPPGNDDFANATVISGPTGTISGTTVGATREIGEPGWLNDDLGEDPINHSIWYRWTAPSTGLFTFNTAGSAAGHFPRLDVFAGSTVGALVRLAWNDDAFIDAHPPTYYDWASLVLWGEAGRVYSIRISASGPTRDAATVLHWFPTPPRVAPAPFTPPPTSVWAIGQSWNDTVMRGFVYELGPSDTDWQRLGYLEIDGGVTDTWDWPDAYGHAAFDPVNNRVAVAWSDNGGTLHGNRVIWYGPQVLPHKDGDPEDHGRLVSGLLFTHDLAGLPPGTLSERFNMPFDIYWDRVDNAIWYQAQARPDFLTAPTNWLVERDAATGAFLASYPIDFSSLGLAGGSFYAITDDAALFLAGSAGWPGTPFSLVRWDRATHVATVMIANLEATFPTWMQPAWNPNLSIEEIAARPNGELAFHSRQSPPAFAEDGHHFSVVTADGTTIIREFIQPWQSTRRIYASSYDNVGDGWWISWFDFPINDAVAQPGMGFIDAATATLHAFPKVPQDSYQSFEMDIMAFAAAPTPAAAGGWGFGVRMSG